MKRQPPRKELKRIAKIITKQVITVSPIPKEDVENGLILLLNKPIRTSRGRGEPLSHLHLDLWACQEEYELPDLPPRYKIIKLLIKNSYGE